MWWAFSFYSWGQMVWNFPTGVTLGVDYSIFDSFGPRGQRDDWGGKDSGYQAWRLEFNFQIHTIETKEWTPAAQIYCSIVVNIRSQKYLVIFLPDSFI